MMRVESTRLTVLVAVIAAASLASAQDLGVEVFCDVDADESCVPDALQVRFANGTNVDAWRGGQVDIAIVIDTVSEPLYGWSYGVSHDPDVLAIIPESVTFEGTDGWEANRGPLFNVTQAVDGGEDRLPGFISAVAIGFGEAAYLDAGRANTIAFASYDVVGEIPPQGTMLRFEDESLRNGPGPPVELNLTIGPGARDPAWLRHGVLLEPVAGPQPEEGPIEAFCDTVDDCIPDPLEIRFGTKDGPTVHNVLEDGDEVHAVVVLDTMTENVQGYSFGVSHDPNVLTILPDSVTRDGTDAGDVFGGGFDVTTVVDGVDGGPPGFISAIVLGWVMRALPVGRPNSLAVATYSVTGAVPAEGTQLRFEDGVLANAPSPPVALNVTVGGVAKLPETLQHGLVWRGEPSGPIFRRGDADGDSQRNIADAILIVRFVAGRLPADDPRPACRDALDVDDDGRLGFADAVALLGYLFGRGDAPPAPFPGCGVDESIDGLECEGQPSC